MRLLRLETAPCPNCGRPLSAPVSSRAIDPFCARCRPARVRASGGRTGVRNAKLVVSTNGYAHVEYPKASPKRAGKRPR